MAQMSMGKNSGDNLQKTIRYIKSAAEEKADLIMFPEVQLSPFFPQYHNYSAEKYLLTTYSPEIKAIQSCCKQYRIYASPNVYLHLKGKNYDASLMIDRNGNIIGISKMVNIFQAKDFYEKDYYAPSDDGFKVFDTPFGKIGIVICFDRHIPESIRTCALKNADLIIIPTANHNKEPMELYEWEIRVQAFQNTSYIAMCNRVGLEGEINFCGQSLVASPDGQLLTKADASERMIIADIPVEKVQQVREKRNWLQFAECKTNDLS
ncbi:carbon-nitrogen hydrolase family protein [Ruminococcus sp.]|uniref:carbon-nitrogen hydrolase family protein n=1 Tax=Ruminococcus sp. TaxID=41978 RepID=UPI002E7936FE|nr:carbon-nitrogen hydrolase family protein [Ruminococcus sp.]